MTETGQLNWKRPESLDYPKVWHTFKAKDTNSDQLAEYRIEDLPDSRSEEAISLMVEYFCREEPLWEAYDLINNADAVENLKSLWKSLIAQKMALICVKIGSNEIAGLNINYVSSKGDRIFADYNRKSTTEQRRKVGRIIGLLSENFNIYEHYGVDEYLGSFGLLIVPEYRGRAIGQHFLNIRKEICHEFGIKLTTTMFTSNQSNRIADKVGFKLDRSISYNEIRSKYPELSLPPIKSDALTLKSIKY